MHSLSKYSMPSLICKVAYDLHDTLRCQKLVICLTLKAPVTTAADDNFFYIFFFYFSEKTSLDISCESSAWQMIHMKCQLVFSEKIKKNKKISNVICYKFCLALKGLMLS